jgi:phytoene/squalene synthetase
VASAVGLCCIEIFGYSNLRAREYAVNLGVALQLTNIMRDVEADAHTLFAAEIMGRTYFALLRLMEHRRFRVFGERVRVPTPKKLAIALRCWIRSRWGERRPRS